MENEILKEAKNKYGKGLKITSLFGATDIVKGEPFLDRFGEIFVECNNGVRLIYNNSGTWAEIKTNNQ